MNKLYYKMLYSYFAADIPSVQQRVTCQDYIDGLVQERRNSIANVFLH